MLCHNRIDVSESIDVNKTSASKECVIYDLFQTTVCYCCHDLLMMSIDINSIAKLNIHGVDYEALNLYKCVRVCVCLYIYTFIFYHA